MITRIAVSIGDPNGIGPEIAVKAAAATLRDPASRIHPVLVGDAYVIEHYRRLLKIDRPIEIVDAPALPIADFVPGRMSPHAGRATVAYVTHAVALARAGRVAAIIGCPQSETAINSAGIEFSGYPPLIADLTDTPRGHVFMMLVAGGLRIGHCTLHEPIAGALARLTPNLVITAAKAMNATLHRLGIARPGIAVCGINPHAGEHGLFGDEDERITKPAVASLQAEGLNVSGPVGADLLISERKHDAYLVMFHDQGHIPIKLLSPRHASAMAIGTPILFSSVGHGCAYDIAGKGVADHVSVSETLALLASVR